MEDTKTGSDGGQVLSELNIRVKCLEEKLDEVLRELKMLRSENGRRMETQADELDVKADLRRERALTLQLQTEIVTERKKFRILQQQFAKTLKSLSPAIEQLPETQPDNVQKSSNTGKQLGIQEDVNPQKQNENLQLHNVRSENPYTNEESTDICLQNESTKIKAEHDNAGELHPENETQTDDKKEILNNSDLLDVVINPKLMEAIENNDIDSLSILSAEVRESNWIDNELNAALVHAAKVSNMQIIKFLIRNGADVNFMFMGETALHWAVKRKLVEVVNFLIRARADVNRMNDNMETPLHLAIACREIQITQTLIREGAYINSRDKNGNTPLHIAAQCNDFDCVVFLIVSGANTTLLNTAGLKAAYLAEDKILKTYLIQQSVTSNFTQEDKQEHFSTTVILEKSEFGDLENETSNNEVSEEEARNDRELKSHENLNFYIKENDVNLKLQSTESGAEATSRERNLNPFTASNEDELRLDYIKKEPAEITSYNYMKNTMQPSECDMEAIEKKYEGENKINPFEREFSKPLQSRGSDKQDSEEPRETKSQSEFLDMKTRFKESEILLSKYGNNSMPRQNFNEREVLHVDEGLKLDCTENNSNDQSNLSGYTNLKVETRNDIGGYARNAQNRRNHDQNAPGRFHSQHNSKGIPSYGIPEYPFARESFNLKPRKFSPKSRFDNQRPFIRDQRPYKYTQTHYSDMQKQSGPGFHKQESRNCIVYPDQFTFLTSKNTTSPFKVTK